MTFIKFATFSAYLLFVPLLSCTPKGEGILNNQSTMSQTIDNATKQAPFAFDIAPDTISYNSCVNYVEPGTSPRTFPGLKIGVSEGFVTNNGNGAVKGGLKLKSEFLKFVGKNFKPQAPSTTITPEQIKYILQNSDNNKGVYLQFAVRRKKDLEINVDLISPGSSNDINLTAPAPGRDAYVFLNDITEGNIVYNLTKDLKFTSTGSVLSEGPRIYNLSNYSDVVPIVGTFGYNQTNDKTLPNPSPGTNVNPEIKFGVAEYYPYLIRKRFNSNEEDKVILTAVFGGKAPDAVKPGGSSGNAPTEATISQIRGRDKDLSKAVGRGYSLKFQTAGSSVAGWMANVLSGTAVTEVDLSTGATVQGVTWACENFVIVPSAQYDNTKLDEVSCLPLIATDLTPERQLAIKKIRRQHSKKDWNIGLFYSKGTDSASATTVADRVANRAKYQLCVSPTQGSASCYLPTKNIFSDPGNTQDAGIQYDNSKECYLTAYNAMGVTYTTATTPDSLRMLGRCANYLSVCTRTSTNY